MSQAPGRVYLVGAGCGAADLITVRGLAALRGCDVVVYDDLIAPELPNAAPPQAERIYMGKRSGRHAAAQQEICRVLIEQARAGKTVVRLKGGDPFVFGRGGEEAQALTQAGIAWEIIPGISSAIAIPAEAGIPVTHRGLSQSVHIVTAHTADTPDGLPACLDELAKLPGTLVFLMGLGQLPQLARRLMAAGLPPDTPAAVVSGGNSPNPAAVRAPLADIAQQAKAVQPPAVIVVGAVAVLELAGGAAKPLQGVTVGLTGTAAVTDGLAAALRGQGAAVLCAARSVVEPLPAAIDWPALCSGAPCWLVFTSKNGVRLFFERLAGQSFDLRSLHGCRFAVIGAGTGAALAEHGVRADLCPAVFTGEALAQALLTAVPAGTPMYLLRSARGSRLLAQQLAARFLVRDVPLYDLRPGPAAGDQAAALARADYLVFASASGVELYFAAHGALPPQAAAVCIGEVTARALGGRAARVLVAREASAAGIVEAILRDRGRPPVE